MCLIIINKYKLKRVKTGNLKLNYFWVVNVNINNV